ncbi:MAG: Aldose 1-epimerase [Edaphobacter sp.]|nr:Aldose 1-epimerase [Edaphobacter sp.]
MKVVLWVAFLIIVVRGAATEADVKKVEWGRSSDGRTIEIYTLRSAQLEVRAMSYGARLVSIRTPDRNGQVSDVILGYDSLQEYLNDTTHVGGVVGRFGNRIANGTFSIDGQNYHVPLNNGRNALHGGPTSFDRLVWKGHEIPNGVEFTLISRDGDMGFPGNLTARVRYTLNGNLLRIDYFATTDKATVLNLTNHAYFNLTGSDKKDILGENVMLNANSYTPINADLIPTGEQASVAGTPLDFRHAAAIGSRIDKPDEQLRLAGGYDHNFILNGKNGEMKLAAKVHDPDTGRMLTVMTTEPGVQFYSGNHLDGSFVGRRGMRFVKYSGFCLETQHYPDSPNELSFPTTVLRPGDKFHSTTTLAFTVLAVDKK